MNIYVLIKSFVSVLFGFLWIAAHAEITTETLKPFKSLCIAEQATGFNWKDGSWTPQKFKGDKYIIQKLDYEREIAASSFVDRPLRCEKPTITGSAAYTWVKACYAISEWGEAPFLFSQSRQCTELYVDEKLVSIQCSDIGRFKPNGLFVMLPSSESLDLSNSTSKDSIVLSVGKCGVL